MSLKHSNVNAAVHSVMETMLNFKATWRMFFSHNFRQFQLSLSQVPKTLSRIKLQTHPSFRLHKIVNQIGIKIFQRNSRTYLVLASDQCLPEQSCYRESDPHHVMGYQASSNKGSSEVFIVLHMKFLCTIILRVFYMGHTLPLIYVHNFIVIS